MVKQNDIINISGRHQSKNANLPKLFSTAIAGLENASVGGHLRAAGGLIQSKDLDKFKENLRNLKL
jgi:hypothetical protein